MTRTFQYLADVPADRPVYFLKYDISDGYWRMVIQPGQKFNFVYVLLQEDGKPMMLVIPSAIQMGWKETPGFFCGASETAWDIIATMAGLQAPGQKICRSIHWSTGSRFQRPWEGTRWRSEHQRTLPGLTLSHLSTTLC